MRRIPGAEEARMLGDLIYNNIRCCIKIRGRLKGCFKGMFLDDFLPRVEVRR